MSPRPHTLLLDLAWEGHHARYLRWILESGILAFSDVTLAAPEEMFSHPELAGSGPLFRAQPIRLTASEQRAFSDFRPRALARRELQSVSVFRRAFLEAGRHAEVGAVMLPYVSGSLHGLGLRGSPFGKTRWLGIDMRTQYHFREMGVRAPMPSLPGLRRRLTERALAQPSLTALFTNDPSFFAYGQTRPGYGRLRLLRDPAPCHPLLEKGQARMRLGLPPQARIVLVYGALGERKALVELIEAAAGDACPRDIHVLAAGLQDRPLKGRMTAASVARLRAEGRLHEIDRYLSDPEEALVLAASDALWVAYRDFHLMSGVLVLGGLHSLPCLVSNTGVADYLVRGHGCGYTVDPGKPASILRALRELASDPARFAEAGRRGQAFFRSFTLAGFQEQMREAIAEALGLPCPEARA